MCWAAAIKIYTDKKNDGVSKSALGTMSCSVSSERCAVPSSDILFIGSFLCFYSLYPTGDSKLVGSKIWKE